MTNIILVNWHNGTNLSNGPNNIFNNLIKGFQQTNYEVKIITPETYDNSLKKALSQVLKLILSKNRYTFIINGNGLKIPYYIYFLSKLNKNHKYFLLSHGIRIVEDNYIQKKNKNYHRFEKFIIKNFPNLISVSGLLKNQILSYHHRKKPIYVIHNGLKINQEYEVEELNFSDNINIIMSGGIKRIKGIVETIDLIENLNKGSKQYKVNLEIYGGYEDEEIFDYINNKIDNGLKAYVKYKNQVSKEELFKAYGEAHFSIALSYSDTFNMSVAESLLCGTPAIISNNCGIAELMEDFKHGLIVDMNKDYKKDIENLLEELYHNKHRYLQMRKECLLIKNRLTLEKMIDNYMEVIK
jgi:glycosyltransferase involved in cell wall biosynthesis